MLILFLTQSVGLFFRRQVRLNLFSLCWQWQLSHKSSWSVFANNAISIKSNICSQEEKANCKHYPLQVRSVPKVNIYDVMLQTKVKTWSAHKWHLILIQWYLHNPVIVTQNPSEASRTPPASSKDPPQKKLSSPVWPALIFLEYLGKKQQSKCLRVISGVMASLQTGFANWGLQAPKTNPNSIIQI